MVSAVGAPRLHEFAEKNICAHHQLNKGDVDKGFAEADHVREDVFFYEGNTHLAMEEHSSIGVWSPDQKLTLYSSTQNPHYLHRIMSRVLGLGSAKEGAAHWWDQRVSSVALAVLGGACSSADRAAGRAHGGGGPSGH